VFYRNASPCPQCLTGESEFVYSVLLVCCTASAMLPPTRQTTLFSPWLGFWLPDEWHPLASYLRLRNYEYSPMLVLHGNTERNSPKLVDTHSFNHALASCAFPKHKLASYPGLSPNAQPPARSVAGCLQVRQQAPLIRPQILHPLLHLNPSNRLSEQQRVSKVLLCPCADALRELTVSTGSGSVALIERLYAGTNARFMA
jgi:hypothetical protein